MAHLDATTNGSGDIHTAGDFLIPGLPWVIAGQNEQLAWGPTNTFLDFTDLVRRGAAVRGHRGACDGCDVRGRAGPLHSGAIHRKLQRWRSRRPGEFLFVPHHGPVRGIDLVNNVAITLRWTLQDITTDANMFTPLAKAETVEQGRVTNESGTAWGSCSSWLTRKAPSGTSPEQTREARLGDQSRWRCPTWVHLDGRCEAPSAATRGRSRGAPRLPQVVDAPEGFIATANSDITGALFDGNPTNDGYPPLAEPSPAFRHARIAELIREIGSEHTTETMRRIQGDPHSMIGELITPGFIEIAESDMTTLTEEGEKPLPR